MNAPAPTGSGITIGTSGYSFPDWVGPFYPPGTRPADFLAYYARHFDIVEVNATYYRIPPARTLEQMEQKSPAGFRFVVKLHQSMTHESSAESGLTREFLAAIAPLKAAGKLEGLLAQFPWGFKRSPGSLAHLEALRTSLPGESLFVEFRHASWNTPDLEPWLRERRLGFCAVDEPELPGLMPPVTMVTAEDAYVRFHGRNAANWWGGKERGVAPARRLAPRAASSAVQGALFGPEREAPVGAAVGRPTSGDRYDYDYSERELREWLGRIQDLARQARRTFLFFNNCHAGQAARSAKLMQTLLKQQRLPG